MIIANALEITSAAARPGSAGVSPADGVLAVFCASRLIRAKRTLLRLETEKGGSAVRRRGEHIISTNGDYPTTYSAPTPG
jgi:hypothetical protein